jgi:flagella basal body P-ring formation protein FlgA
VTAPIKTEKSTQPVSGPNASALSAKSVVLVDPRQLARLHLHSANSTMLLLVRPLQTGHINETIRVRLVASGRTLQAKVIAANSLDATF